jgi:hypothetical protein
MIAKTVLVTNGSISGATTQREVTTRKNHFTTIYVTDTYDHVRWCKCHQLVTFIASAADKSAYLLERIRVSQLRDSFTDSQLTSFVLSLNTFRTAHLSSNLFAAVEFVYLRLPDHNTPPLLLKLPFNWLIAWIFVSSASA